MDPVSLAPGRSRSSLLSLPNELLLQLLREQTSLQDQWDQEGLIPHWFAWHTQKFTRYTIPWSKDHHCIALPLSQTCRRLRDLMLPSIWEEIGVNTLEDLARARDGLRFFPERGKLVKRFEWSWWMKHPAQEDADYCAKYPEITEPGLQFLQLEVILQPPYRWPKQPLTTRDECNDALTEFICRLVNLDTLLWVSPFLGMQPAVVDFLSNKALPLRAFQIDMGGNGNYLMPQLAAYWKFTGSLVKLSINYMHSHWVEKCWLTVDLDRWISYDDELTGLDDYCKEEARWKDEDGNEDPRSEKDIDSQILGIASTERQRATAFKILWPAYQGSLRSIALDPGWVLCTPIISSHLVRMEEVLSRRDFRRCCNGHLPQEEEDAQSSAHLGPGDRDEDELYWYDEVANWHLGARAIRPALYHLARHRKRSGPLTGEEVQTLADKPPVYPASLFYPHFSRPKIAQGMADRWEELVEMGESERVRCTCTECR